MSEFRQDPTTRDWVIITPERAGRPRDIAAPAPARDALVWDPECPFCPGNEEQTPREVLRLPHSSWWQVRVVPNKYAALTPSGSVEARRRDGLFVAMDGVGFHEVIVESPDHSIQMADMEQDEVEVVLRAYRERYRTLREDPRIQLIMVFRNQGEGAGTSLAHPHSQLVAAPLVPPANRRRFEVAREYYEGLGRCVYCDLRDEETAGGERLVVQSEHFVVLQPFASRVPHETWIVPRRHVSAFGDVADAEIPDLALALRDTLKALSLALGAPDFNYVVQSASVGDGGSDYYLWHMQIIPRTTHIAGLELGTGIHINTALPEETARLLRDIWGAW